MERNLSVTPLAASVATDVMVALQAEGHGHGEHARQEELAVVPTARAFLPAGHRAAEEVAEHQDQHHREQQRDDDAEGLAQPVDQVAPGDGPGVRYGPSQAIQHAYAGSPGSGLMHATSFFCLAGAVPGEAEEHVVEGRPAQPDVLGLHARVVQRPHRLRSGRTPDPSTGRADPAGFPIDLRVRAAHPADDARRRRVSRRFARRRRCGRRRPWT